MTQAADVLVFKSKSSRATQITGLFIAAFTSIGALALTLLAMFLSPSSNPSQLNIGLISGCSAAGVMCLINAFQQMRHPREVRIEPGALIIKSYWGFHMLPWQRIAGVRRDIQTDLRIVGGTKQSQAATLVDSRGRKIGTISTDLEGFEQLLSEIEQRCAAASGTAVVNHDADRQRRLDKQRKKGRRLLIMTSLLALGGFAGVIGGMYMSIKDHQLAQHGIETPAHIDRLYMKSVTGWIDVSYDDTSGHRFSRSTTLPKNRWDAVPQDEPITIVRYLPSDPSWSEVTGEETDPDSQLIAAGAGIMVMFGSYIVLRLFGYVDFKSVNGKWKLVRMGEDELSESI